jgi:hypothetical protein
MNYSYLFFILMSIVSFKPIHAQEVLPGLWQQDCSHFYKGKEVKLVAEFSKQMQAIENMKEFDEMPNSDMKKQVLAQLQKAKKVMDDANHGTHCLTAEDMGKYKYGPVPDKECQFVEKKINKSTILFQSKCKSGTSVEGRLIFQDQNNYTSNMKIKDLDKTMDDMDDAEDRAERFDEVRCQAKRLKTKCNPKKSSAKTDN